MVALAGSHAAEPDVEIWLLEGRPDHPAHCEATALVLAEIGLHHSMHLTHPALQPYLVIALSWSLSQVVGNPAQMIPDYPVLCFLTLPARHRLDYDRL